MYPYTVPSAPIITSVVANYRNIQIYFDIPANNGSPITNYKYNISTDAFTWYDISGTSSPFTIYNTPVNFAISVRLIAVNIAGNSAASALSTPVNYIFTVPSQITTPLVSVGLKTMTVPVIAPTSVGSSIIKYSYSLNAEPYLDFSGLTPPFIIDISNNVDYNIRVTATNSAGTSIPSIALSAPVKYVFLPPATGPVITNISQITLSGNTVSGAAMITFTPPNIRNVPITSYVYIIDNSGGTPIDTRTTSSPIRINNIPNVVPHTLYLYAVTSAGLSPPTISRQFAIDYTVPSIPIIKSTSYTFINATTLYVNAVISPPTLLHGSQVMTYYYSLNGGSIYSDASGSLDMTGPIVNMIIPNFPINVSTNIIVAAVHNSGRSSWSIPVSILARFVVPSAPKIGTIIPTANTLTVIYTPSLAYGSPITSYNVSVNGGEFVNFGIVSPIVITGLTTKTKYSIVIRSTNAAGTSPSSSAFSITTL